MWQGRDIHIEVDLRIRFPKSVLSGLPARVTDSGSEQALSAERLLVQTFVKLHAMPR
jgi:hypothetical protein